MGVGLEKIKIRKFRKGVKPGGKKAYEESMARDKINKKGDLAKEELVRDWERRKKSIKCGRKTTKEIGF